MDDRDVFDWAWDHLHARGYCDARFSAEYNRLRDQWDMVEGPHQALQFIRAEANKPPAAPAKPEGGAS